MEYQFFSSLLQNLLHLNTISFKKEHGELLEFAEKYCYHTSLQPMFASENLSKVVSEMSEGLIYELRDPLGIRVELLCVNGYTYLIGPFVTEFFDENKVRNILISHRLPASYALSIRLYYIAFPIISSSTVISSVNAFLHALFHVTEDYVRCRLTDWQAPLPDKNSQYMESFDYNSIHRRYEDENHFLRLIETGDTENVMMAYDAMSVSGMTAKRYFNAVYQDVNISFAMVRALARKAAERGGASLLEIDEITQRAVQKNLTAKNVNMSVEIIRNMILELTEAVKRHRQYGTDYSTPVRKAIEHIRLNFSQELSLCAIADKANLTAPYLSRQFKKEVGMTPSQYIQQLRCQQAAVMLYENDKSIGDISAYVGYPDGNYFVKVFKKQYGITPSEYRLKNQKKH